MFFDIHQGNGASPCNCDPLGSVNKTCHPLHGQCVCRPGVTGRQCDQCMPRHWGFSDEGCKPCDCDPRGSESLDCDVNSGQCLCRQFVEGQRCDQCVENRYDLGRGCLECDDCYSLIGHRRTDIRKRVDELRDRLDEVQNNPVKVEDKEFDDRVSRHADSFCLEQH